MVFIAGIVVGLFIAGLLVWKYMPELMIQTERSGQGIDETVEAIEKAIVENGWGHSNTYNLNEMMAKKGVEFPPQVRLVQLCNPNHAKRVLTDQRRISCMMPCTMGVYETDDGAVCVSKLNTGLMGKLFGGVVAEVMGGSVPQEEKKILKAAGLG